MSNENRRKLVMLRALDGSSGYSGYARTEIGGGRVTLNISVQGFTGASGPIYGMLLGSDYSAVLGPLNVDVRGQGGLKAELPLNNVGGVPYTNYGVLAVGRDLGDKMKIALVGNIGRDSWVDYGLAEKQVLANLHGAKAAPVFSEEEPAVAVFAEPKAQKTPIAAAEKAPAVEKAPVEAEPEPILEAPEIIVEEAPQVLEGQALEVEEAPQQTTPAQPVQPIQPVQPETIEIELPPVQNKAEPQIEIYDLPALDGGQAAPLAPIQSEALPDEYEVSQEEIPLVTKEDVLGRIEGIASEMAKCESVIGLPDILKSCFWPQTLWPLNDLFTRYELEQALCNEEQVFIKVQIKGDRYDHCLIGAKLDGNWVTGAGFGVPGAYGETPQGFESAEFITASDGNGYYVIWEDAR